MEVIRFALGNPWDWSNQWRKTYLVLSNKPVEAVRDAHLKIKKVTGFDIEATGPFLTPKEQKDLKSLGYSLPPRKELYVGYRFIELWLWLLRQADPGLDLILLDKEAKDFAWHSDEDDKRPAYKNIGADCFRDDNYNF